MAYTLAHMTNDPIMILEANSAADLLRGLRAVEVYMESLDPDLHVPSHLIIDAYDMVLTIQDFFSYVLARMESHLAGLHVVMVSPEVHAETLFREFNSTPQRQVSIFESRRAAVNYCTVQAHKRKASAS